MSEVRIFVPNNMVDDLKKMTVEDLKRVTPNKFQGIKKKLHTCFFICEYNNTIKYICKGRHIYSVLDIDYE